MNSCDKLLKLLYERKLFSAIIKSRPEYNDKKNRDCKHPDWIILDKCEEDYYDNVAHCTKNCGYELSLMKLESIEKIPKFNNFDEYVAVFRDNLLEQLKPYYSSYFKTRVNKSPLTIYIINTGNHPQEDAIVINSSWLNSKTFEKLPKTL